MSPWSHLLSSPPGPRHISHLPFSLLSNSSSLLYLFVVYTYVQVSIISKKNLKKPRIFNFISLFSYCPFFLPNFPKEGSALTYSPSSSSFAQFIALWLLPPFSADIDCILGIHNLHVAKFKGYFLALTSLEIFAAFDAVDRFFLLESLSSFGFLPWHYSLLILLLLSVSSQLSSWPYSPLWAPQMLAFPEFSP